MLSSPQDKTLVASSRSSRAQQASNDEGSLNGRLSVNVHQTNCNGLIKCIEIDCLVRGFDQGSEWLAIAIMYMDGLRTHSASRDLYRTQDAISGWVYYLVTNKHNDMGLAWEDCVWEPGHSQPFLFSPASDACAYIGPHRKYRILG